MGKMDNKISGMREDIQNQSTRLVQKIIEGLPSEDKIKQDSKSTCDPAGLKNTLNKYEKTKKVLKQSKRIAEQSEKSIVKIQKIANDVKKTIDKIGGILDKIEKVLKVLKNIIRVVGIKLFGLKAYPRAAAPVPYTTPLLVSQVITDTGKNVDSSIKRKDKAKGKVASIFQGIRAFTSSLQKYYNPKLKKFNDIIKKALKILGFVLQLIDWLISICEVTILSKLKECADPTLDPEGGIMKSESPEEFLKEIGYPGYATPPSSDVVLGNWPTITPAINGDGTNDYGTGSPSGSTTNPTTVHPSDFEDPLTKYLQELLDGLQLSGTANNQEYIDYIYRLKFETIEYPKAGYYRYFK